MDKKTLKHIKIIIYSLNFIFSQVLLFLLGNLWAFTKLIDNTAILIGLYNTIIIGYLVYLYIIYIFLSTITKKETE